MVLTAKIEKALSVALRVHEKQKRKGDNITPYAVHPITVAVILSKYTEDEDIIIAGLLHDALENTSYSPNEIEKKFGKRVLDIVKEVSEKNPREPWEKRKVEHLLTIKKMSEEACLVTCADKIHNLKSLSYAYAVLGDEIWARFNASKEKKIWYYESIYKELKKRFRHGLIRELHHVIKEIKGFKPAADNFSQRYIGPFDLVKWGHFNLEEGDALSIVSTYDILNDAADVANKLTREAREETIKANPIEGTNLTLKDLWILSCSFGVYDSAGRLAYWSNWHTV